MKKSLVIITLFLGFFVASHNAEAAVTNNNIFKSMKTLQFNPWDPRVEEESKETDSSGKEDPEPEQSESETEE